MFLHRYFKLINHHVNQVRRKETINFNPHTTKQINIKCQTVGHGK